MSKCFRGLGCIGLVSLLGAAAPAALEADFVRGDADRDGQVSVSDPVVLLRSLFAGDGAALGCLDAADANDDGTLDPADAIAMLRYLFLAGELPAPGASAPGPDPTCDRLGCADAPFATPAIVINEVHFHPEEAIAEREFVELRNRTPFPIDLGGYRFTEGIAFTLPESTVLAGGELLVIARDPNTYRRVDAIVLGPYEGRLADGGERLTLEGGGCVVETFVYDDRPPWPLGADGYGPSLERFSPTSPAADPHSWRASLATRGTAGSENSVAGRPTHPFIVEHAVTPAAPRSSDSATVSLTVDLPAGEITAATLRWEASREEVGAVETRAMEVVEEAGIATRFEATIPPQRSQTLVRYNFQLTLAAGTTVLLPPEGEPSPFFGFFVYDFEVPHRLPLLWLFRRRATELVPENVTASGAVVLAAGSQEPQVFPRAQVRASSNGQKVHFLKGLELGGMRTINVIPEQGGGGTAGRAPHMEHLGFATFRRLGALAPGAEWYRVIDHGNGRHTQNVVIEQVNERFFAAHGFDADGDIYKVDKNSPAKQNNLETGLSPLLELFRGLRDRDDAVRRANVESELDLENIRRYSVLGMLVENWDGFHNNFFLYHGPTAGGAGAGAAPRWRMVPWDLDQVFEECCYDFPLSWPLDGRPVPGASYDRVREAGVVSRAYHREADLDETFRDELRAHVTPGGAFTVEAMEPVIAEVEALLLEDLELQESYLGEERARRRNQITDAYASMRRYLPLRIAYLREQIGVDR